MMCAQYAACAMTQHLRGKYTYYILYDKGIYCFFSKKAFAGGTSSLLFPLSQHFLGTCHLLAVLAGKRLVASGTGVGVASLHVVHKLQGGHLERIVASTHVLGVVDQMPLFFINMA